MDKNWIKRWCRLRASVQETAKLLWSRIAIYRACCQLSASSWLTQQAAAGARHWWRGRAQVLNAILTVPYFDRLGLPRLS